ncbi:hypothetical protein ACH5RR_015681 [Cinchona calisaya]|uniref:Uncharacterized protein n=1 Tax=Cinchona calisaya TaxID=153742 RepID=A0ABD2ZWI4_9GENT
MWLRLIKNYGKEDSHKAMIEVGQMAVTMGSQPENTIPKPRASIDALNEPIGIGNLDNLQVVDAIPPMQIIQPQNHSTYMGFTTKQGEGILMEYSQFRPRHTTL